jgi:hypothetical protein
MAILVTVEAKGVPAIVRSRRHRRMPDGSVSHDEVGRYLVDVGETQLFSTDTGSSLEVYVPEAPEADMIRRHRPPPVAA